MKFNTKTIIVTLILIILAILYFYPKPIKKKTSFVINKEQVTIEKSDIKSVIDSLSKSEDYSERSIKISKIREDLGSMLISYSTKTERSYYAYYSYKDNKFINNIGFIGLGSMDFPIDFINSDYLIFLSDDENSKKAPQVYTKNVFTGETKPININIEKYTKIETSYNGNDILIFVHKKSGLDTYSLNTTSFYVQNIK